MEKAWPRLDGAFFGGDKMEQLNFNNEIKKQDFLNFDYVLVHPLFIELNHKIIDNFWKFHKENPHVFELFLRYANELFAKGHRHYGIAAIAERIRWHYAMETTDKDFKLNNNYKSCYARLIVLTDSKFENFFNLRASPGTTNKQMRF
jgi:hypothetical protein